MVATGGTEIGTLTELTTVRFQVRPGHQYPGGAVQQVQTLLPDIIMFRRFVELVFA
jgi:hypothetical protein